MFYQGFDNTGRNVIPRTRRMTLLLKCAQDIFSRVYGFKYSGVEYFRQSYVTRTLFVLLFYSIPLAIIFSQVVFGIRKFSGRKEGNSFNEDSLHRNYVQITFLGEMKFILKYLVEIYRFNNVCICIYTHTYHRYNRNIY